MKTKDMKTGDVVVATRGTGIGVAVVIRPEIWNNGYRRFAGSGKKYNHSKGSIRSYEGTNGIPVVVVTTYTGSVYSSVDVDEKIIEKAQKEAARLAKLSDEKFAEAMDDRKLRYGFTARVAPSANFTHTIESINAEHRAYRKAQDEQRSAEKTRRERQEVEVATIKKALESVGEEISLHSRYNGSYEISETGLTALSRALSKLTA